MYVRIGQVEDYSRRARLSGRTPGRAGHAGRNRRVVANLAKDQTANRDGQAGIGRTG